MRIIRIPYILLVKHYLYIEYSNWLKRIKTIKSWKLKKCLNFLTLNVVPGMFSQPSFNPQRLLSIIITTVERTIWASMTFFSSHVQWHSIPYVPNLVNQWICCSFSEMEETDPIKPQKDLFSQLTRSYLFLSPIVPQHTNYHQDLMLMPSWRLNCNQPESATNVKPIQNKKNAKSLKQWIGTIWS